MTDVLREHAERERWVEVEALFAAALDQPAYARESLLASSCSDDAVRDEVRRLLARHHLLSTGGEPHDRFLDGVDLGRATALLNWDESRDPENVGRYQIGRRLGRGATGVVYLARDAVLDRQVALKLLSPGLSCDPLATRRFADEARAASALDHPHIAAVYEFGRAADDRLFIVMAYQEGETLRERLGRGPLPVDEAVRIAAEIADGLSAAHGRNIIHRDIKPENILLTARGAVIVDFGIAKVAGHTLTRTGAALGTAAYMSPEQTRGAGLDYRSDLWSLGVVLYEMLAGSRPFEADSGEALIYRIRHDEPALLSTLRPGLPPPLARVVRRCLEKEPEQRHHSAEVLQQALCSDAMLCARRSLSRRWTRIALGAGSAALAAAAVLPAWNRPASLDRLNQASTLLPLPKHPGSLAILSLSEGPSNEEMEGRQYLTSGTTEGIGEELTRGLSATPGIRVSSRASVKILFEAGADVVELGRRLGVGAVLEWSLRARDTLVTVDARLIRVSDGGAMWSDVYHRSVGELGAVPEQIRRSVAEVLGFGSADPAHTPGPATNDLVAYDLFLRGLFASSKWTPAGWEEADSLFGRAIERDPAFALAHTWLARIHMTTWSGAPAERFERVKPLLARALELDSTMAYAHRLAGQAALWYDRDYALAGRHLGRALALDASDVWNYYHYAYYLAATGRTDEALSLVRQATTLDPYSSLTADQVGFHLYLNRDYTRAVQVLERALQVDTTWWRKMPLTLGRAYLAMGRHQAAIARLRRAGLESSYGFEAPAVLAYALGRAGRHQEARALAAQYIERARASSARPLDLVAVQLGLGNTEKALDWVEQLPGDRGSKFFLLSDPMFDPLRDSPRFQRVLQRLNLSE